MITLTETDLSYSYLNKNNNWILILYNQVQGPTSRASIDLVISAEPVK